MALKAGQEVGRYIVESTLGRGGMATVYKVRHLELGSVAALKVLDLVTDLLRERFRSEGRFQASLRHPNVVAVQDVLEVDGRPALLMEYIDGPDLGAWLRTRPTDADIERVFRELVAGVGAAHDVGLVHRDLKPANVLMATGPHGVVPKVADFGVAKDIEVDGPTMTGFGLGTPGYMAPEQIRQAKDVDKRADVFALGVILYEMYCGSRPFDGADTLEVIKAAAEGSFALPSTVRPDIPPAVEAVIRGCLQPHRGYRLPDCEAVLEVLDGKDGSTGTEETWSALLMPDSDCQSAVDMEVRGPSVHTPAMGGLGLPPTVGAESPSTSPTGLYVAGAVAAAALAGGLVFASGWFDAEPVAPAAPMDGIEAVVVRPYQVVGGQHDWVGSGLAADLTFALASAGGPRVVSQSAFARYDTPPTLAELGRDLDVDAVIEGTVVMSGESLRVQTSIVRLSDSSVVFADAKSGTEAAVAGPTGTVAHAVLGAFDLEAEEAAESPERKLAWGAFVQGREIVSSYERDRYDDAEEALRRAIALDPTFVDARAELVRLLLQRGWLGEQGDALSSAEAELRKALAYQPDNPRALRVLGRVLVQRGQLDAAFEAINRAVAAEPENPDAYIDRYEVEARAGALELGQRDLDHAEALDPFHFRVYLNQAWMRVYSERVDEIDAVIARSERHYGKNAEMLWEAKIAGLRMDGRLEEARALCVEHACAQEEALLAPTREWLESKLADMGSLGPMRPNGLIDRARYEVLLGRHDAALASLKTALAAYPGKSYHLRDPIFDPIREEAEFVAALAGAAEASAAMSQRMRSAWK